MLKIDLSEFIGCLSETLDLTYVGVGVDWGSMPHGARVCYISSRLAEQLNVEDNETRNNLYYAALLHDVGLYLTNQVMNIMHFETHEEYTHCNIGYEILRKCPYTESFASIVLHHHDKWTGPNESGVSGDNIPFCSRIIYVADRIDVLLRPREYILHQKDEIVSKINSYSGTYFDPLVVEAFNQIARMESFWLDLTARHTEDLLRQYKFKESIKLDFFEIEKIAEIFAQIVDSKSRFTLQHSRRVSQIANKLATCYNFSPLECELMKIAGLLHDLGKLAIPDDILDKPNKLTNDEYEIMKRHTYFTNIILNRVHGFDTIAQWASLHHEKLNGSGYPFHTKSEIIPLGARILAVSDVFTALAEDRPYRKGYSKEDTRKFLGEYASDGALDLNVVDTLIKNIDAFYALLKID